MLIPTLLSRSILLFTFIAAVTLSTFGQAPATAPIEPCPATPATKPGTTRASAPAKVKTSATQTEIDSSIADDPAIEKIIAPYAEKVRPLSQVVGKLDGVLKKGTIGAGNLGYFVTDAMRSQARATNKNVVMAIANAGGLRKNEIAAGELRASDIFELLPFENALITIDLTGAQLSKLTQILTRDAQSGAKIQFRWNEQSRAEVIEAKLLDADDKEHPIDNNATYTIVTIDYLYNLKSGTYALLQEGKNVHPLGVTLREVVMNYVKELTAAGRQIKSTPDERFVQIGPGPANQQNPPR